MSGSLRIAGGSVYDPANGIDGDVRDICIENGRIVAELPADAPRLDASGLIVMPGGVDIHSHVAGGTVNLARRLLPEEHDRDPAWPKYPPLPVLRCARFAAGIPAGGVGPASGGE